MTTYYVDNRLEASGDGLSPANAFNSLAAFHTAVTVGLATGGHTIELVEGSGPYNEQIDWGRTGNIWSGNGCTVEQVLHLRDVDGYGWTPSGGGTNEYYLTLDGGDPGLNEVRAGTVNGVPFVQTAAVTENSMGTLGALVDGQCGWGDADTLGYNTLYIRSDAGAPWAVDLEIKVARNGTGSGTGAIGITTYTCNAIEVLDLDMAYSNNIAVLLKGAAGANGWKFRRCRVRVVNNHAFQPQAASTGNLIEHCVTWFPGHRVVNFAVAGAEVTIANHTDVGAHLFALIASALASGTLRILNSISAYGESGFCQRQSTGVRFIERNNILYPKFGDSTRKLGYTSAANWPTTDARDRPARDNTDTQRAAGLYGVDPRFVAVSLTDFAACDLRVQADSPAIGRALGGRFGNTDFAGVAVGVPGTIGAYEYTGAGPRPVAAARPAASR